MRGDEGIAQQQAMVIGPTPPGTGVIAPATSAASSKATSPTSRLLPSSARHAVDADVDHRRARLDPVAADHLGPADGGDDDVGAAHDVGQVAGSRMGDGDGALSPEQQLRHRLADDVRAADHDRVEPGKVAELLLKQIRQPSGVQGTSAVRARSRAGPRSPGGSRRRPCPGRSSSITRVASICAGSGSWTRMPSTARSALSSLDQREQLVLAESSAGRLCSKLAIPASRVALALGADIDGARRILADQDHGEARARRPAAARIRRR